jgi:hypothetical protein
MILRSGPASAIPAVNPTLNTFQASFKATDIGISKKALEELLLETAVTYD